MFKYDFIGFQINKTKLYTSLFVFQTTISIVRNYILFELEVLYKIN